jgi:DNA (cytosine-5)-methyltransferase 1
MIYGSVCTGVSPHSKEYAARGWKAAFFAEIGPFPSAVLAAHYPEVPNLGDMTKIDGANWKGLLDVLMASCPCQTFSFAGLRKSLDDARGNLTLKFVELVHAINSRWVIYENVPGILNTEDNAFGCFLAGLVGADAPLVSKWGWPDAGMVIGPVRTAAWRILDAQYFSLAQRRRRVFVVSGRTGDGTNPGAVLFEPESVRRDFAPSRETRERVAGTISARTKGGGGLGTDFDLNGGLVARSTGGWCPNCNSREGCYPDCPNTPETRGQDPVVACFGGNNTSGPIDVATAVNACNSASGRIDFESETFVTTVGAICADSHPGAYTGRLIPSLAPTLDARAGRSGETSFATSGGLIPIAYRTNAAGQVDTLGDCAAAITTMTDPTAQIIAFSAKDHGADAMEDCSPTLRSGNFDASHANGGVMPAVCYSIQSVNTPRNKKQNGIGVSEADAMYTLTGRDQHAVAFRASGQDGFTPSEISPPILSSDGGGAGVPTVAHAIGAFKGGQGSKAGGIGWDENVSPTLPASDSGSNRTPVLLQHMAVRRLLPTECEQLQGWDVGYTDVPYRGKKAADGNRYKAIGNGWAVPVLTWIAERISLVDKLHQSCQTQPSHHPLVPPLVDLENGELAPAIDEPSREPRQS